VARTPTVVAVQHLTDTLRALGHAPAKGQTRRIDDLEARLLRAVERDLTGLPLPDGYPARTSGDAPGGHGGPVDTSVEASVIFRVDGVDGRPIRDRHHELTARAAKAVEDAVVAVNIAFAALDSIDDLTKASPPAPKTCDHCTGKRGQGGNRPIHVRGTVGDRLARAMALCEACYWFVHRTAAAGSHEGYLPSDEQIRQHEDTGRWRVRVNDRRKRQNGLGPGQT
jgi:hypothetical protein